MDNTWSSNNGDFIMKQAIIRMPLFDKRLIFQFRIWYHKVSTHYGITNETHDGYFLPFWDFAEEFKVRDIFNALYKAQTEFGLSTIYVFQSSPTESYRAVAFDKMIWTRCVGVIGSTQCLDNKYLDFSILRGRFVLRLTEKELREEKLVGKIPSNFRMRPISNDHQAFFSVKYPDIPKPIPYPDNVKVKLSKYESFR